MALLTNKRYANIEFQDYVIRYAELKSQKKPVVVTNCDEHYLPSGVVENGKIIDHDLFSRAIKQCVRKWQLKGKQVRFIVPDSSVIVRKMDVPSKIADEELVGHVYFELGHSIHLPFENPLIDVVPLGAKSEDTKEVLVVASSEEIVNSYYNYLKDERVIPTVADISPLCQYRLLDHFGLTNENDQFMLIQCNVKSVSLSIFEQHRPVFTQEVNVPYPENSWKVVPLHQGGQLNREQFQRKHVLNAFEEVYNEIDRILRFYQFSLHNGERQITRILMTGDHPFLEELMEHIKERYGIPLDILPPNEIRTTKNSNPNYKFYNVLGLAMKEGD
ncbi:type IV pilus biogenesis protein PilM [Salirhabdus salicampi]|uniref:type IV pilus biogenesis protein PilM n=1 Tax=Salirhabdus salicampi TaxID=476102 RepID=UPI0020C42944|nr:pilus assembly protein PilM [Salirhabdus salicampi]MCP8617938.1 pilus assembly protein PilM [Salirhabdus salicampi]